MKKRLRIFLITMFAITLLGVSSEVKAQSEGGRLAFGFDFGLNKYWGEFTDNQFWLAGELFFRYNLLPQVSLQPTFGLGQIRYKTDKDRLADYPTYFGPDAKEGDFYPNSTTLHIRDKNSTRFMTYELLVTFNLFSHEKFVPYIFAGAGLMDFEPKAGDTGYEGSLPNNAASVYKKQQFVVPLGIGFELYLTDNLVLNGKGTYRLTNTDYLDDLSNEEDPKADDAKDQLLTFGLGFSYYILGDADYDKDGLTNASERELGTDPYNPDTDGDGLKDGEEVYTYYSDPLKADTDGDNLTDYDEVVKYKTSPVRADTDADGLNDGEEIARKTDPNIADTDKDGLLDGDEVKKYETDPLNPDTDADNLKDGEEVNKYSTNPKSKDTDADGLMDGEEVLTYKTNPANSDTDQDGLKDGLEVKQYKTDPNIPDSDKDGLNDGPEVNDYGTDPMNPDTDGDTLNDGDEVRKFKTNPLAADTDKDGLGDGEEINTYKTDPLLDDTDKDNMKDGQEVKIYKTDPLNPDTDTDLLLDGDEVAKYRTNPLLKDTDNDKLSDGDEVNKTKTDPTDPDTDKDSIIDGEDDCPLIAGVRSDVPGKNGCPAPPKIGTKTDFPDILFIVNTDKFNFDEPNTALNLAKLLQYVNQCEGLQVMIEGHASEEGNKKRNQELSELRAKKVVQWLIEQGVKPDKISGAVGYGSSQPKVKEPTGKAAKNVSKEEIEKIRKQNRRITVSIVKSCD